jgi:polyketide cyclase/dehydrase/lipid transport protein
VWEYLSDFRSTNDWDPGTVLTERTSGDGGAGTTYRNTSKFLGRETELEYTVTEVVPGRRITLEGRNKSVTSRDTITVDPTPAGGTVVTYLAEIELHGVAAVGTPVLDLPLKKLGDDAERSLTRALDRL